MKHRTKVIILIAVVVTIIAGIVGYSLYINNKENKTEDVVQEYNKNDDLETDENGKVVDSDTEEDRLDKATDYLKNVLVTMYRIDEEHSKEGIEKWVKEIGTNEMYESQKDWDKNVNDCVITQFSIVGNGVTDMDIEGTKRKVYYIAYTGIAILNGQEKTLEKDNANTKTGENCGRIGVYYDNNNQMILCAIDDNM